MKLPSSIRAAILMGFAFAGFVAVNAQVVGTTPTPLTEYYFDASTGQYLPCPSTSSATPSQNLPQPVVLSGWNATLHAITPTTSCTGAGIAPSPPAFSVQAAGPGSNPTTQTSDPNFQVNTTLHQGVDKLPRVNILHTDFGSGCPLADPTGHTDSTCAIQAAVTYLKTQPTVSGIQPCLYIPSGRYLINGTITIQPTVGNVCIVGDYHGGSVLFSGPNSTNAIMKIVSGTGDYIGYLQFSGTDHTSTGTLLEIDSAPQGVMEDVEFANSGGRGLQMNGSAERWKGYGLQFADVRWPFVQAGDLNENHFFGLQALSPGVTEDNYCFNVNCVNGVYPSPNSGTPVTTPWVASTFITGASSIVSFDGVNNYQAQTYGTTGTTKPTGCTPVNTCTITDGTVTWLNIGIKTLIVPDPHAALFLQGVNESIEGGSIKSLQYMSGIQSCGEDCRFENLYMEGLQTNGNYAFSTTPFPEHFPGTGALTGTGLTASISNWQWMPDYFNDCTDAAANVGFHGSGGYNIYPNTFQVGNSSPSNVSGVNRNQFESVEVGGTCQGGSLYLQTRNMAGSTAPAGTAWPAGQWFMVRNNFNGLNGTLLVNDHVNVVEPTAGTAGYAVASYPNWPGHMAADYFVGLQPDGQIIVDPLTVYGQIAQGSDQLAIYDNSDFNATNDLAVGEGRVLAPIQGNVTVEGATTGFTNSSINSMSGYNGINLVRGGPSVAASLYSPTNGGSGTFQFPGGILTTASGLTTMTTTGTEGAGGGIGGIFHQFTNQECWYDSGTPANTQPQWRFCLHGGSGLPPLVEIDHWNGSSFQPTIRMDPVAGSINSNGNGIGTMFSSYAKFNTFNDWVPQSFQGAYVGPESNLVTSSGALASTAWHINQGTGTVTDGVTDVGAPGNPLGTSTKIVNTGTSGVFQIANNGTTLTSGLTYTPCIYAYGLTGTESVSIGADDFQLTTPNIPLSWNLYCDSGVADSGAPTKTLLVGNATPGGTIYVDYPDTFLGSGGAEYYPTTTAPHPNPTPMVLGSLLDPTQSAGCAQFGSNGSLTSTGTACATSSMLVGTFTSTAAATQSVPVTGLTSTGHCVALAPTNATATGMTGVSLSTPTTSAVTFNNPAATAGGTFIAFCTTN